MSKIKGTNTSIEAKLKRAFRIEGLKGWRSQYKLFGKPDFVFPRYNLAIFCDGDFWHGYNWRYKDEIPPPGFWQNKILNNIKRDKLVNRTLRKQGWKIIRLPEYRIKSDLKNCITMIKKYV